MSPQPHSTETSTRALIELKAGNFTLPVMRLLGTDLDGLGEELAAKVEAGAGFFQHAPVVIDLSSLPEDSGEVPFPLLVGLMRGHGMIPVGVRGGNPAQHEAAAAMELAVLADPRRSQSRPRTVPRSVPPAATHTGPGRLLTHPIRSGQRVYARGGDLVVMAAVSSGAEILADGHIHVYAPLRGRALAGVKGDATARIFCRDLQAELVSVAGYYRISENIGADLRGRAVQVFLEGRELRMQTL